jgi:hypothetical protein
MMLRRPWIAAFIGAALRRELTTDPDWAFDVAEGLDLDSRDAGPELAADSGFGPNAETSAMSEPPAASSTALARSARGT